MFIYKITNVKNNKVYIGQTIKRLASIRFSNHVYKLTRNKHANEHLQRAWNKYGRDSFTFEVIETCLTLDAVDEREVYWISFYKATNTEFGYNKSLGGHGTHSVSDETRRRISIANTGGKGRLGQKLSEKERLFISNRTKGHLNPMYGKTHTPEARKKISIAASGDKHPCWGKPGRNSRKVKCLTNGKVYNSATEAALDLNCDRSTICRICRKNSGKIKGLEFTYI